jgi:uncharacterized protein YjgD (DUF1641 family)
MAEPLKYRPRVDTRDAARDELEALLQALHESGNLRVLTGLAGKLPEVLGILLEQSGSELGRNALGNLTLLAGTLGRLGTDSAERFSKALTEGLERVHSKMPAHPPGLLRLTSLLSGVDARRGLYAVVLLLQSLGEQLDPERPGASTRLLRSEKRVSP